MPTGHLITDRDHAFGGDVDLDHLAAQTEGYSGADIRALVNEAGLQALIRIADSQDRNLPRILSNEDFSFALTNLG